MATSLDTRAATRRPDRRAPRQRIIGEGLLARLGVAMTTAALVSGAWWLTLPGELQQPDDIIGFPSFYNFDFRPLYLGHRLVTWVIPVVMALTYWATGRWGPLSTTASKVARNITTTDIAVVQAASRDDPTEVGPSWRHYPRLLIPAMLIALSFSARSNAPDPSISFVAVVLAVTYVLAVLSVGVVALRWTGRPDCVSLVHAYAAGLVAVGSVAWFARHSVTLDQNGAVDRWSWIPLWFVAACAVAVIAWVSLRLRQGVAATSVEQRVVAVLAGSAVVYLLVADMPGAIGTIQGFDDSHSVVGADLFSRGYFPWRDVLFMHGIFEDGLRSNVGFVLFEPTFWGADAASRLIWTPLIWVSYYLLVVWAAPRSAISQIGFVLAVPWLSVYLSVSVRWVAVAVILILLGETLRRRSPPMTIGLTTVLFCGAILVPEMSFQVIAVALVLVLSDLSSSDELRRWRRLARTRDFVATGLVLLAGWWVFLAAHGSVRAWIDYYLIFGPGHAASGALPLDIVDKGSYDNVFFVSEVVTAAVIGLSVLRMLSGRRTDTLQWVILAAAVTTGLYAEKGLGRFDAGHILQVFTVALPSWLLLMIAGLRRLDLAGALSATPLSGTRRRNQMRRVPIRVLGGATAALVLAFAAPAAIGVSSTPARLLEVPAHNRSTVPNVNHREQRIGYTLTGQDGPDNRMIVDLSMLLDTLTPRGSTVYDFTNSPGYFTYLLQEQLATRFYTVGVALPEISQDQLVEDLQESNPAVVVFDDLFYGLPVWDGPRNEVRHFETSPYLLEGWTPVVSTYGFLFMLRNDLVDDMPDLPDLRGPIQTEDLYSSMPPCEWGFTANFLASEPSGPAEELVVGPYREANWIDLRGWTFDAAANRRVDRVLVTVGGMVAGETAVDLPRDDVAAGLGRRSAQSGFSTRFSTFQEGDVTAYAVTTDGVAFAIGAIPVGSPDRLVLSDGTSVPVSDQTIAGSIDGLSAEPRPTATVKLPPGTDLQSYGLATFETDGASLSDGKVEIEDPSTPSGLSRSISFQSLSRAGSDIPVRVGACLQWYGYTGSSLVISQSAGDEPITRIRLSDVQSN